MTTFFPVTGKCAVCGHEMRYEEIGSTSSFGPSDLDTRPAPLARYILPNCIRICPKCGYANFDIETLNYSNAKDVLASEEYQNALKQYYEDSGSNGFILRAILAEKNDDHDAAGRAFLNAAWMCDDFNEEDRAAAYRRKSVDHYLKALQSEELSSEESDNVKLIVLDLYRRTGQFEKVAEFADQTQFHDKDGFYDAIKAYQIYLSQRKDTGCHNCDEARESENAEGV